MTGPRLLPTPHKQRNDDLPHLAVFRPLAGGLSGRSALRSPIPHPSHSNSISYSRWDSLRFPPLARRFPYPWPGIGLGGQFVQLGMPSAKLAPAIAVLGLIITRGVPGEPPIFSRMPEGFSAGGIGVKALNS
jgi:hypothetical protein